MTVALTGSQNSGPIGGSGIPASFPGDLEVAGAVRVVGNLNATTIKIDGTTIGAALAGTAAPLDLPLNLAHPVAAWKDGNADSPGSGILGLTDTLGAPLLGNVSSNNVKTDKALFTFSLPAWYVAGSPITVRIRAKKTTTLATVSDTIDVETFGILADTVVGSDLCATAAQQLTTSAANYNFTITPTSRVAGETVCMTITAISDDTGGAVGTAIAIHKIQVLLG